MKMTLYRYPYLRLTIRVPLSHCTSHTSNYPGSILLSLENLYLHMQYVIILGKPLPPQGICSSFKNTSIFT